MNQIHFHEVNTRSALLRKRILKQFLLFIFKTEKKQVERVDIIFCTDEYLLTLNKTYLDHDYYTDTLSFLLSKPREAILGEIYISTDRVKSNTMDLHISYKTELVRIIIHSCLHLCGYMDKPKSSAGKMIRLQEKYLKLWMFHVKQTVNSNT